MTSLTDRFSANVRHARQKAGISQEHLAALCDVHRTEISLIERGQRAPRLATIIKLAASLGTTPEALCAGLSWSPRSHRFKVEPTVAPSGRLVRRAD